MISRRNILRGFAAVTLALDPLVRFGRGGVVHTRPPAEPEFAADGGFYVPQDVVDKILARGTVIDLRISGATKLSRYRSSEVVINTGGTLPSGNEEEKAT